MAHYNTNIDKDMERIFIVQLGVSSGTQPRHAHPVVRVNGTSSHRPSENGSSILAVACPIRFTLREALLRLLRRSSQARDGCWQRIIPRMKNRESDGGRGKFVFSQSRAKCFAGVLFIGQPLQGLPCSFRAGPV